MENTFTHFWKRLKNGELRLVWRRPMEVSQYVSEVVTYHVYGEEHSVHTLIGPKGQITVDAWCGYDRGPKLQRAIAGLF